MDTWTPPVDPDPSEILREAECNTENGLVEVALQQFLWFHEHALEYEQGLEGVRLSFALHAWHELGRRYRPALEALMEMRDKAEARVREGEAWIPFHDFSALNEVLDDDERSKALFSWLHVNRRSDAVAVFHITLPALVRLRQYALCAQFVNPIEDRERMFETFNATTRIATENYDGDARDELRDFAQKKLVNEAATLVGILAQAGRDIEARDTAEKLLRENLLPELAFAVEAALEGHIPAPYP